MQKMLRLLMLLSGKKRFTITELMDRTNQSDRTIYRHLAEIESAGFVIDRSEGRYNLVTDNFYSKSLNQLLHFTEEEACVLYKTIELLEGSSPLKNRLAGKLNSLYNFKALGQLEEKNIHEMVHQLGEAIRQKKQVLLRAYRSSNSDTITDRIVEPFEFLGDYSGVWCYDVADKAPKHFKVARIAGVEVLTAQSVNQLYHILPFTDAFRMSAAKPIATVKAKLTLKAYNLLLEEYPLAEEHVKAVKGHYELQISVADYNGIGRFALGLQGDMKVKGPVEFINFLKGKVKYFID